MLLLLTRVDKITNNFDEQSNGVDGYKCLPCIPMIQIIQMEKSKYRNSNKSNKSGSNKRSDPIELPFAKELV